MQTARLPSREIMVVGNGDQSPDNGVGDTRNDLSAGGDAESAAGATSGNATDASAPVRVRGGAQIVWFWASMVLLLLWAATIGLWLNARKNAGQATPVQPESSRESYYSVNAVKDIKSACDSNDPQKTKEALLAWSKNRWPDNPPTSLGHFAQRVNDALGKELLKLNTALYKPGGAGWDKNALQSALNQYLDEQRKKDSTQKSKIKPLFRIASNQ